MNHAHADTRRTEQGHVVDVALLRDFIRGALQADWQIADELNSSDVREALHRPETRP